MIAVLHSPVHRITLAIALSALVHAAILWLPHLHLPRERVNLPPLSARLAPLPKPLKQIEKKAAPAATIARQGKGSASAAATDKAETLPEMSKSNPDDVHLFPKRLQLDFDVYRNGKSFRSGEVRQRLDIRSDSYILCSVEQITRLSGAERIQTSYGKIAGQGLQPDSYEEEKISGGKRQKRRVVFDRSAQEAIFSGGDKVALPDGIQDMLSFMYQLAQFSMQEELFSLPVSDGSRLEQYRIEIGAEEDIATPMGDIHARHLRRMHDDGEAYFEVWLGTDYRMLPVKFRRVDGSGKTIEEWVISDIRASSK